MKQDLPSYIANDAAPLFPDFSAMSDKEFMNYESPPERLAFYPLHTEEGLNAFLYDVYWIGYPGLFIATKHVWSLLIEPRAYHCTLMGQMSGAGGTGKQALVKTLEQFITEALATFEYEYPRADDFENLEAWHCHCMAMNRDQDGQVHLIVDKYAAILNGEHIEHMHPNGEVVRGPWKPLDDCRVPESAVDGPVDRVLRGEPDYMSPTETSSGSSLSRT